MAPVVPENVQKKQARDAKLKTESDLLRKTRRETIAKNKTVAVERAQKYA